jgi:murein DD-endopeptidase MepM/ murein hydrolase activator NlpD
MARLWISLLVAVCAFAASPARGVELEGTWYVLIHYKDAHAENPDTERWDDRVWVFAKEGTRLRWTEYAIVVFDDESGRFERRQTGQYARILHFWEPSATQQADIRDGLKVNTRGSKTKTLRGSDAKGWSSGGRTAAASASVLTYTEIWSIEGLPGQPVFSRSDVMGSGRSDSLEGLTRYTTQEVRAGGAELVGSFERDDNRRGSFRMLRSGPVGSLEEKTLEQRQRDGMRQAMQSDPQVRDATRESIEHQLEAIGVAVTPHDVDALTATALRLGAQGAGPEAIQAALAEDLRKLLAEAGSKAAIHDVAARYRWPFDSPAAGLVLASEEQGLLFALSAGTPVVAARDGVVTRVVDGYPEGESERWYRANSVYLRHPDGTVGFYGFLKRGIPVKRGQSVKAGEQIGAVGSTPGVMQPRLQFAVLRIDPELRGQLIEIRFAGPTPEGVVAEVGKAYGGR